MTKVRITFDVELDTEVLQDAINDQECSLYELKNNPNAAFVKSPTITEELLNLIDLQELSAKNLTIDFAGHLDDFYEYDLDDEEDEEEEDEDLEEDNPDEPEATTKTQHTEI